MFKNCRLIIVGMMCMTNSFVSFAVSPEQIQAASEFSIEGVGFQTTLTSFKTKFTQAKEIESESEPEFGVMFYRIDTTANTDGIDVIFYNNKVMELRVWYFPSRINSVFGTWTIIGEKLVKKIGHADEGNQGTTNKDIASLTWRIPEAKRYFNIKVTISKLLLKAVNMELYEECTNLKNSKANVGF